MARAAEAVGAVPSPSAVVAKVEAVGAEVVIGGSDLAPAAASPRSRLVSSARAVCSASIASGSHEHGVPRGALGGRGCVTRLGEFGLATECQRPRGNADGVGLRQSLFDRGVSSALRRSETCVSLALLSSAGRLVPQNSHGRAERCRGGQRQRSLLCRSRWLQQVALFWLLVCRMTISIKTDE